MPPPTSPSIPASAPNPDANPPPAAPDLSTPLEGPLHRMPGREPTPSRHATWLDELPIFPAWLFRRPHTVLVYGPSRSLVNLTLFALASHANPEFHWVEIGGRPDERSPSDPIRLGWIPSDRLWFVRTPDSLRPNREAESLPLSQLISSEEPPESLDHFAEFLRLPELSQRIIAAQSPNGRPGVVAVTNVDRVEDAVSADRVPSILEVHRNSGFSVMVGAGDSAGPGRNVFDFVFRLQGKDEQAGDWKHHHLVCEKGISSGPLRNRLPVRLDQIPLLAEVLSKARSSA